MFYYFCIFCSDISSSLFFLFSEQWLEMIFSLFIHENTLHEILEDAKSCISLNFSFRNCLFQVLSKLHPFDLQIIFYPSNSFSGLSHFVQNFVVISFRQRYFCWFQIYSQHSYDSLLILCRIYHLVHELHVTLF